MLTENISLIKYLHYASVSKFRKEKLFLGFSMERILLKKQI